MDEPLVQCPQCGHRFPVTKALTDQIEKSLRSQFEAAYRTRFEAEKARLEREAAQKARDSVKTEISGLRKQIVSAAEAARIKATQDTTERLESDYRTRDLQHQKVVADLRTKLDDAKHKLDQSSQQTQGEVIELELEKLLSTTFPDDDIRPVAKGKLGADIIQKVNSGSGQHCGTIVWESKNTKNWNPSWLTKLRGDQRREKAEIAVIVSSILPKDVRHFGLVSGVWVADFSVAMSLAIALRANLIDVARVVMSAQGKSDKMEVLYRYLMSTEFRQRVEAIVEAFVTMKDDLQKEKQAIEKNWAKREKHLQLVLENVSGLVGGIQAITPAFPRIKRLELSAAQQ